MKSVSLFCVIACALASIGVADTLRTNIHEQLEKRRNKKYRPWGGVIPLTTVNDPLLGWTPTVSVSTGGGESVPVLIDTGSSIMAVCNTTNVGNAKPLSPPVFGCCAYGNGYNGWIGEYVTARVVYGQDNETVSAPQGKETQLAKITTENTAICTPYVKGILGVDMGSDSTYDKMQLLPSRETGIAVCDASQATGELKSQFAETMLTRADGFMMGFMGVNSQNKGSPSLCFGKSCKNMVKKRNSAGGAKLTKATRTWYTFDETMVFELVGIDSVCHPPNSTNKCKLTYSPSNNVNSMPVIDSGTQQLVLPSAWKQLVPADVTPESLIDSLPADAEIRITMGKVNLSINLLTMCKDYVGGLPIDFAPRPVLGFPVFWYYDIIFDGHPKKKSFGHVSFYER